MMDHAAWATLPDRHLEGVEHQFRAQVIGHRPADDLAAAGIQHDGEIEKASRRGDERDIGDPELVRPACLEVAVDQIGCRSARGIAARCYCPLAAMAGADQALLAHQAGNPFATVAFAVGPQHSVHTRRSIGPSGLSMHLPHAL